MEFKLLSGAKFVASPAEYGSVSELKKSVFRCMARTGIFSFKGPNLLMLLADDECWKWVFECGKSASYEGVKVSRNLFDDPKVGPKARTDEHEIFAKILEVNLDPFFENASFESTIPSQKSQVPA